MAADTHTWWTLLCSVSALNLLAWLVAAQPQRRRQRALAADALAACRLQLLLSAVYVLGCGYRSVLPVFDVQRQVLVDSWASSVIVGRSVATLAELAFAAQWALLLRGTAQATGSRLGRVVSHAVLPLIALAELCSWHAVLTTSNAGHVLEESLWGLCAALLVASLLVIWPHSRREARPLLATCCAGGLAYVAYMALVDVPMYWARWLADEAAGRRYLGVAQGVVDASVRWVVSHRWEDWRSEVVWMTLYFSVAVWLSIALVHAPRLTQRGAGAAAQ
jgi:hypothetical protein